VNSQRIRFAILLPLLALAVWYFLVPAQIGFTWLRLHELSRQSSDGNANLPNLVIPRSSILSFAIMSVGWREGDTITALNLPGDIVYWIASLPFTGSVPWHPSAVPPESWRSFCLPFFCLPAWWFVGRGLDALLGWRHPRRWTLLIGTLLSAGFLVLLLGLTFAVPTADLRGGTWILWGFALWTLAFGVFPAAWIHVWLKRKKSHPEPIKISI
jgi:hypothetical protein